jgi:acetyl esterase/lipase
MCLNLVSFQELGILRLTSRSPMFKILSESISSVRYYHYHVKRIGVTRTIASETRQLGMDTSSLTGTLWAALPKIPLVMRIAAAHTLNLSENAQKWELRQELVIRVLRSFLEPDGTPKNLSSSQAGSIKDPGVSGKKWISRYTIPKPEEDDVREHVFKAIDDLGDGSEIYTKPALLPVEIEWTGYRAEAGDYDPEPEISEEEKYQNLMSETTSDVTILYFHGGAYYLMDPATHRSTVTKLCQMTGGRAMSVRYRLAPQNPFPAALLDAFVSYLSLLHPPPGAPHTAVPASHIVISGDSAGGNLSLVLLQLLLQLHRDAEPGKVPQVRFHGALVDVPLPAGVALNSPWCDQTSCLPSIQRNARYDYLPNKWERDQIAPCPIWPTDPPRADIYADGSALMHPLVSPVGAQSWKGAPPVFFVVGEELLTDDGKATAGRMVPQGVKVVWEQYEAMPHCFGLIFESMPVGQMCFEGWAGFIRDAVEGKVESKGGFVTAKKLERNEVDVTKLMDDLELTHEKIEMMMKTSRDEFMAKWAKEQEKKGIKHKDPIGGKS